MPEIDWLAQRFDENRQHLRKVAMRILGTSEEADDAVQEAWMRLSRAGAGTVENLGGWLTTTVARVCLDMLRARRARPEPAGPRPTGAEPAHDPQDALLLADSIGPSLLVVLELLEPAERVAFVLHDMFDLPFDEIAAIVGRSPEAARQLASRARRRVQGDKAAEPAADLRRQREVVQAFLTASREGNFDALLAVLDPRVVLRGDAAAVQTAAANGWVDLSTEVQGSTAVAGAINNRARGLRLAVINGAPGAVWSMGGAVRGAWLFTLEHDRITAIELVMDPQQLSALKIEAEA
jgi:RNA polymerase sigma-70 factor (ECF subfamily)